MKKILALIIFALVSFVPLSLTTVLAHQNYVAVVTLPPELHPDYAPTAKIVSEEGADTANYWMQMLAGSLLYLAAPVAILVITIGGLRYVISHGEDGEIENAKKTIQYGIIGLLVVMFSFAIVQAIIITMLGMNS